MANWNNFFRRGRPQSARYESWQQVSFKRLCSMKQGQQSKTLSIESIGCQERTGDWCVCRLRSSGMIGLPCRSSVDHSLTWYWHRSFIRYDNPTIKLCRTDADGLKGEPELESQGISPAYVYFDVYQCYWWDQFAEGQYLALRLHLSLAASQYATMALREVMKQQTSAAYHSGLKRARVDDEQQQA